MHSEYYQEDELKGSLSSFEESLKYNENRYFEIHEFEFIIDHYLSSNDISKSKKALQNALNIHPKNHELQKRLAQINNVEGLHKEAILTINNSFNSFGTQKDIDYYLILGEAYLGINELDKADVLLRKAVDISGEEFFEIVTTVAALYQQEGFFENAIQYLKKVEDEDSSLLFDIAMGYYNISAFSRAIKYFEKFIPTAPFSADAWYYISLCNKFIDKYKEAEDAILNAIAIDPNILLYQYDLAKIYIDQIKYIDALELYKEILSKDKNVNHTIFLSIGDISYNLEQYENARKNYEIALRLNPESEEAFHSLGLVEIESQDYTKAKLYIQKAIAISSSRVDFFMSLGTTNQLMGDDLGAEYAYLEAVKLAPEVEGSWSLLVDFYYLNDRPQKAIETNLQAFKEVGETSLLQAKMAAANFDLGNREEALLYLKKSLTQNKNEKEGFLEYYPEALTDNEILELLSQYS